MFRWAGKYVDHSAEVAKRFRRAAYRSLERLGFLVRGTAQASITEEPGPSSAGSPPHTHARQRTKKGGRGRQGVLPGAILYALDKSDMSVIIGPSVERAGTVGAAFEHPGIKEFRGEGYPGRPFMGPALQKDVTQLPGILAENFGGS
jgi:hypothetical protein